MTGPGIAQLLEAAHWLRLGGDTEGARKLYLQVIERDPSNPTAADFLAGKSLTLTPLPMTRGAHNPFQRVDPVEPPDGAEEQNPLDLDWGKWAGTGNADAWNAADASPPVELDLAFAPPNAPAAEADPLDLVAESALLTSPPSAEQEEAKEDAFPEVSTLLEGARDLLELDDHSGAMELLTKAESIAPEHAEVRRLKQVSENALIAMFESKLGDGRSTPRVTLADDEIIWLNLDHRAGFVLAQIDGTVTFEDLFALSGMSRFDTARILSQLLEEGVISP